MTHIEMCMSGEQFTDILSGLRTILTEARITASIGGIMTCHVDTSNTQLVKLVLSPKYFVSYKYDNGDDDHFDFGVDVAKYARIKPKKTDVVRWVICTDAGTPNKPAGDVIINNTRTYSIDCFDIYTLRKHAKIPSIPKQGATVELEGSHICDALSALTVFGDRMSITYDGKPELVFISNGYFKEELNTTPCVTVVDIVDCTLISSNVPECKTGFNNYIIQPIIKYLKNKRKIELTLGQDYPIRLTNRNLGQDINSEIMFIAAPRNPTE